MQSRISSAYPQSRPGSQAVHKAKAEAASQPVDTLETQSPSTSANTAEEDEFILRQFDLQSKYGPVSGLSRLQRWERAAKLGLQPPEEIREVIMRRGEGTSFDKHLFTEGKV